MNQGHVFSAHIFTTLIWGSMWLGATICHVLERNSLGLKIFDKENLIGSGILGGWCGMVFYLIYGD